VTYEAFAAAWPSRTDDMGFADRMNAIPKYVVSRTLEQATWNNSTVISGNLPEQIVRLKSAPGNDILVVGSRSLAQYLMDADLIDEYRLMVFPIVIGGGARLFGPAPASPILQLVATQPLASGTVILTYTPHRGT
jgi:dihydrofolate reductase